jgi:hypothetical protein
MFNRLFGFVAVARDGVVFPLTAEVPNMPLVELSQAGNLN